MDSKQIGVDDARKTLGPLVDQARSGTDIILTRYGRPVARIVPIEEPPMPTITEHIATLRTFSTVPVIVDALGLDTRNPAGWDLSVAEVSADAKPFARLITDIDAFFGDEINTAFTGPESTDAETEARRIIAEHLATTTMRLALTAAAASQTDWATADSQTLQQLARVALQRAADLRFVEVISPMARAAR